jgi:hypothetical protein
MHCVSQYRGWLLIYSADESCSDESSEDEDRDDHDSGDDEDSDKTSEVGDNNEAGSASKKLPSYAFGPIPRLLPCLQSNGGAGFTVFFLNLVSSTTDGHDLPTHSFRLLGQRHNFGA